METMKDYILILHGGHKLARTDRHIYGTLAEAIQLARGVQLGFVVCGQPSPRVQVWSGTPNGPRMWWPYQDAADWRRKHNITD
jgi:hypothetical protein